MTALRQTLHRRRRSVGRQISIARDKASARFRHADVAIFHEFRPPPDGGGHQFLRALWKELESRGHRLENNTISSTTQACLYNSFNFDFDRLRRLRRSGCKMVHRVDGPIGAYRGRDDGTDTRIWQINRDLANATVFQSEYSLRKHAELGLDFKSPTVIMNAADPIIFNRIGRPPFDRQRKVRLISTSWSDNPNKGADTYRWLDGRLDWDRFEFTFVGRARVKLERTRTVDPVPPNELADLLRQHDIYIAASRNDPCSNALIEALSCGLPALYLDNGGHPEIVGQAGFPFTSPEEVPELLVRLVDQYEDRQARISVPSIKHVADRYLRVMDIETG